MLIWLIGSVVNADIFVAVSRVPILSRPIWFVVDIDVVPMYPVQQLRR